MHYFNIKQLLKEARLEVAGVKARKWWWPVWDCICDSFHERENRTALLQGFSYLLDELP